MLICICYYMLCEYELTNWYTGWMFWLLSFLCFLNFYSHNSMLYRCSQFPVEFLISMLRWMCVGIGHTRNVLFASGFSIAAVCPLISVYSFARPAGLFNHRCSAHHVLRAVREQVLGHTCRPVYKLNCVTQRKHKLLQLHQKISQKNYLVYKVSVTDLFVNSTIIFMQWAHSWFNH